MKNLTFKAAMLKGSQPTVNRQSTDGQSQRHCKQTPLSKRWKVLMTLVFLFTFAIGQMWAAPTQSYVLTGYSSSIANGKTANIGGAYCGRKGSNVTPSATYGLPSGGGKTAAVFVVNQASTITFVMDNQQTSAKSGTVLLASVTDDFYTDCQNGTLGDLPSPASQNKAVSFAKNADSGENEFTFESSVSAGKYVVYWTSGINASIYLKRIEINAASSAPSEDPVTSAVVSSDATDKDHVAKGSTVNLTCTAENATTWQWYLGDDPISGATSSTYSVTANTVGTFAYKVAASNSFNTDPVVSSAYSITVEQNYDIHGLKSEFAVPTAVLNLPTFASNTWNSNIDHGYVQNSNTYTISAYAAYQSASSQTWVAVSAGGSSEATWNATGVFAGSTAYMTTNTSRCADTRWGDNKRSYSFRVKNATNASVLVNPNGNSGRKIYFEAYEVEANATTLGNLVEQQVLTTNAVSTLSLPLNKDKEYVLVVVNSLGSGARFYELALTFPNVAATGVALNKSAMTLSYIGATEQLTATVSPATATNKNVSWTIAPAGVATVVDGLVTAVAAGTATVTATSQDGGFTATCNVTVENNASTDATLSALSVAGCELNETFDPATLAYTVDLPFYASMPTASAVTATKNDANASDPVVSIEGNVISIVVTPESGAADKKTYTITVNIAAAPAASSSINIEQGVLDYTTKWGYAAALTSANIAVVDPNALDSLKDQEGRNEPFLGLKLKKATSKVTIIVPSNEYLKIKFGSINSDAGLKVSVNGSTAVAPEVTEGVYTLPASAGVKEVVFTLAAAEKTVVLKQIMINEDIKAVTLPWKVSFDVVGHANAVSPMIWKGTALTLPGVSNIESGYAFENWNDGSNDYLEGAEYTPTNNVTLTAVYTMTVEDRMAELEFNGVAVAGFSPDIQVYNLTTPYAEALPQITKAVAVDEANGATATIQETYWDDDNNYYVAQAYVIPAGGTSSDAKFYQVRFTMDPKLGATIFRADLTAENAADFSGMYVDADNSQVALKKDGDNNNEYKFAGTSNFIKMALADATFAEGDMLKMTYSTNPQQAELAIYDGTTKLQGTPYTNHTMTFTDVVNGKSTLFIRRTNDNTFNGWVAAVEVQRYMDPFIKEFKIGEAVGTIDQVNKTIAVEVPYATDVTALTPVIEAYANGGATLDKTGAQDFSSPVTYKVSSAYEEDVTYTVTVTEAAHYEAKIGETGYATLVEAVAAAVDDDVVVLQENVAAGAGVMIAKADAKQITIDFGGYTYTANSPAVGSVGTQNQAFHFEKGCDITLKNGTITSEGNAIIMLVQNYGDLTLENITLDGSGLEGSHRYVMSNNCGDVVIGDGTTITAKDGDVAFDVCATNYYPDGVTVTVKDGANITGIVEYDVWGTKPAENKAELAIEGGNFNITWNVEAALAEDAKENLNVSGGQFSEVVPADYCAEGFAPVTTPNAQGKYEVEDKRIYIFNGITSSSSMATSPSGAISWAKVGDTMGEASKSGTYDEVNYVKALQLKNSSTTKHFRIDVDINNNAKIEVIGMSNDNSDTRHAWLTNSTDKGEIANAIAGLATTGYNPEMFATDWLEEGSYYLHADNTVNIFLIRVTPKAVPAKCEVPTITTQPATDLTFGAGNMTATVEAEVSDGGTLKYQWYNAADDSEVVGATAATLSTADEGTYYVIVTNTLAEHRDNAVKSDNATLAHRVMNDATLSALSVSAGTLAPAFDPAVENYTVNLAKGTTGVPTLTATATMDGYANVAINNAAEFVNYEAVSTVVVTSEDLSVTKTYTVHYYVAHQITTLVDVTENTIWDWTTITARADGSDIDEIGSDDKKHGPRVATEDGLILANYVIGGDNWDKIEGNNTAYVIRNTANRFYQGASLHFHSTKAGYLKINARNDGNTMNLKVANIDLGKMTSSFKDYVVYVPAGDVVIENVPVTAGKPMRVAKITFTVDETPDYTRTEMLGNGVYGTICLPYNVPAGGVFGVTIYELMGREPQYGKLAFDEIVSGEMEAGVPYVFQAHGDALSIFYGETHVDDPVSKDNGMYGTFTNQTLTDLDDVYYFAQRALWSCDDLTELNLPANRAYVKLSEIDYLTDPNPAPGRRRITMTVNGEKVTTGIGEIETSETPMKVLIDGQIFIIRGEKMFDVTGKLVK